MSEMTSKERMLRTFRHQEADRIPMLDSPWGDTTERWIREGMPKDVDWRDYFGFDKHIVIGTDNSPRYECRVIEENERYITQTTKWGRTCRKFKDHTSTDDVLDLHYSTSERWPEAKAAMLKYSEDRIPWDMLKQNYDKWTAEGTYMELGLWFGFDVAHSWMIGTENFLIAMYEEPEWVTDVFDTYLTTSLDLAQRILDAGYKFDAVFWQDDMGYKGSTFFSLDMYRELLKPFHKKAADWAHERGLHVRLHSCGFIEPIIPDLIDIGIEMLNPMEIKAGMDPAKLKSLYGDKLAFHGGINAQIWDKPEIVKAEMERIIPTMKEGGGYVFASDHSIPASVSLENMKMISELAHKLGKY